MRGAIRSVGFAAVISGLSTAGVFAQDVVPPTPAPAVAAKGLLLSDGTEISVRTIGDLSGKTSAVGDVLTWRVNKPVVVDNYVVIAEGAPVKGVVSEAKGAGMMGRSGKLNIRLESTKTVDGQVVKVRASQAKTGDSRTGTTVALVVLFGPIGLIKHGKEGIIKDGTVLSIFTDEDIRVVKAP
jgi:hypothetical protein